MSLYIFNPSTEIALSRNSVSFTPAKQIIEFEKRLCLLPALYAPEGSGIFLTHSLTKEEAKALPYHSIALARGMELFTGNDLRKFHSTIASWGWNKALLHNMRRAGIAHNLPEEPAIDAVRNLAHRNTTVAVWTRLIEYAAAHPQLESSSILWKQLQPQSFTSTEEAMKHIETQHFQSVLKSPWSSSGRGVYFTAGIDAGHIHRRVADTINAYGAILVEPLWKKSRDFATEWSYNDGHVEFLGFSLFKTDDAGRYSGNIVASQHALHAELCRHVNTELLNAAVTALKSVLPEVLAPLAAHFNKPMPFGIDMLSDTEGQLNPCVEINLRYTMGHVALKLHELTGEEFLFIPGKELPVPIKFATFAK